jgi:lysyl-tRNA synthetase class I
MDAPPEASRTLLDEQRRFLTEFTKQVANVPWRGLDLHYTFQKEVKRLGLELRDAVQAVHKSFMEDSFTPPVGWFLAQEDRQFVLNRIAEVIHQDS